MIDVVLLFGKLLFLLLLYLFLFAAVRSGLGVDDGRLAAQGGPAARAGRGRRARPSSWACACRSPAASRSAASPDNDLVIADDFVSSHHAAGGARRRAARCSRTSTPRTARSSTARPSATPCALRARRPRRDRDRQAARWTGCDRARAQPPRTRARATSGRVRTGNEDSLLLAPPLFAVADGLGGHQAGEVASRSPSTCCSRTRRARADAKALGRAVRAANRAVIDAAAERPRTRGDGHHAHRRDDRRPAHRRRARRRQPRVPAAPRRPLERVTQDHSMVADLVRQGSLTEEEARVHPNRSVITRALGQRPEHGRRHVRGRGEPGRPAAAVHRRPDEHGRPTTRSPRSSRGTPTPQEAVDALIAAARLAGGYDNITAIVVDLGDGGADAGGRRDARHAGRGRALWVARRARARRRSRRAGVVPLRRARGRTSSTRTASSSSTAACPARSAASALQLARPRRRTCRVADLAAAGPGRARATACATDSLDAGVRRARELPGRGVAERARPSPPVDRRRRRRDADAVGAADRDRGAVACAGATSSSLLLVAAAPVVLLLFALVVGAQRAAP